jgi:hypothetical protein
MIVLINTEKAYLKIQNLARHQWLMPVVLDTQEAVGSGGSQFKVNLGK